MDKDALCRMALTHFAAGGVGAASLASIAADAGVSMAAVARVAASKDALFRLAVTRATRALTVELQVIADSDSPPAERLLRMTRRIATPSGDEAAALFAVLRETLDGNARAEAAFEAALFDGFGIFVRVIGEAQFRGDIKPLPPRFLISVLLSGIVLPQLIGYGGAEGVLHGVHARDDHARDDDVATPPRSALLAASIEAVFNGIARAPIAVDSH